MAKNEEYNIEQSAVKDGAKNRATHKAEAL